MPRFEKRRAQRPTQPRETASERLARQRRRQRQEHDLAFALIRRQDAVARSEGSLRGIGVVNGLTTRVSVPWKGTDVAYLRAKGLVTDAPMPQDRAVAIVLDARHRGETPAERAERAARERQQAGTIGNVE